MTKSVILLEKSYPPGDHILPDGSKFYVCDFRTKCKICILAYHNLCFCVLVFLECSKKSFSLESHKIFFFSVCVRGNMDSIAICILRRAICILQKFLGNMDTSSKQFLFRRKESILHLHPYCRAIWILFSNHR